MTRRPDPDDVPREKRDKKIMVLLATGKAPDQVSLTSREWIAVLMAQRECGYAAASTFIRDLAVAASAVRTGDAYQRAKGAADAMDMPLGQWLRLVTLAGVGLSRLPGDMTRAVEFVRDARKKAQHVAR